MTEWMNVRSTPTEKRAYGPLSQPIPIDTREGTVIASEGDYVIQESDGHLYPIGPEKFADYYEVLDE